MADVSFADHSVLVIDDETFTRAVLVRMLGGLGFKAVFQAQDGEEGIVAVRECDPDVIVCDIQMKPMDGLSFLRTLRQDMTVGHRGQRIPVIFITSRLDAASAQVAHDLGCHGFLLKPVTPVQLKPTLQACLATSG